MTQRWEKVVSLRGGTPATDRAGQSAKDSARWPVMVLAYNEERHIAKCLDSIVAADHGRQFEVFVMANGCTDRTAEAVKEYATRRADVHLVSLALGDKCNAWNVFVHETALEQCPGREIYFFMDGDARVVPGSFAAMARTLRYNPRAHAASALPASGRNVERDRQEILAAHGLVANLYALRGDFVERLRALGVRLPLGLEGDDGLLGALIKWDLAPERQEFDAQRIMPCAGAAFEFDSMSLTRPEDWKLYWKRALRYSRRRYEFELLGPLLKARGIGALPSDITELYARAASLPWRWAGIYTLANLMALRQMRSLGKAHGHRGK